MFPSATWLQASTAEQSGDRENGEALDATELSEREVTPGGEVTPAGEVTSDGEVSPKEEVAPEEEDTSDGEVAPEGEVTSDGGVTPDEEVETQEEEETEEELESQGETMSPEGRVSSSDQMYSDASPGDVAKEEDDPSPPSERASRGASLEDGESFPPAGLREGGTASQHAKGSWELSGRGAPGHRASTPVSRCDLFHAALAAPVVCHPVWGTRGALQIPIAIPVRVRNCLAGVSMPRVCALCRAGPGVAVSGFVVSELPVQ